MSRLAKTTLASSLAVIAIAATGKLALADDTSPYPTQPPPQVTEPAPTTTVVETHPGRSVVVMPEGEKMPGTASLLIGGGMLAFTNESVQDATSVGGMWEVRAAFGNTSLVGFEAAYVGSATPIRTLLGPDQDATLVGTGLEGAARINFAPAEIVTPFAFVGLGWKRYDVANADFRSASTGIADEDTLIEVPMGGGVAYRSNGLVLDARFTFRAAIGEDLVVDEDDADVDVDEDPAAERMDNWAVNGGVGFEF